MPTLNSHGKRSVIFYAGSLRPSGGLSVAKIVLEALIELEYEKVIVYTGSSDGSEGLSSVINSSELVEERKFFPNTPGFFRYLLSKIYFLFIHLDKQVDKNSLLLSVDYYVPTFLKLLVLHLNLGLYVDMGKGSLGHFIKRFDSRVACRLADLSIFESNFLMEYAKKAVKDKCKCAKVLYMGADREFYERRTIADGANSGTIAVVSSTQPHKDNECCISALVELKKTKPGIDWNMTFAGGQSKLQWHRLRQLANDSGVGEHVTFTGPVTKAALVDMLASSLCLISASKVESFCMVAIESMAAGCPVIVTMETSMPESVGTAARIVEAGNAMAFSQEILRFQEDHKHRSNYVDLGYKWSEQFHPSHFTANLAQTLASVNLGPNRSEFDL